MTAAADGDFIVRAKLDGLKAAAFYHYRVVAGANEATARPGMNGVFKTLPAPGDATARVAFCMGSCDMVARL